MHTSSPGDTEKLKPKGEGKRQEDNAYSDILLWVGNRLGTYQTPGEFVMEAQLRGCCRRLPFVPSQVERGKTKVFLAHRGGPPTLGIPRHIDFIFGYFVLDRIEIFTGEQSSQFLWPHNYLSYIGSIKEWEEQNLSSNEIESHLKKKLKKEHLLNITKGKTSERPPTGKYNGKSISLIEVALEEILEELLEKTQAKIKKGLIKLWPYYLSQVEGFRMCERRKGPPSIYAVDALCAAIHDDYRRRVPSYLSKQSKKSGKDQQVILADIAEKRLLLWAKWLEYRWKHWLGWQPSDLLRYYIDPFEGVVKKLYSKWQLNYPIDPRLENKTQHLGELVVFKKPFPILERLPQADFRGVRYIDGDKLINQIAKHTGRGNLIYRLR